MPRQIRWGALALSLLVLAWAAPADARVARDLSQLELGAFHQSMGQSGPEFKAIFNAKEQFGMLVGGRGLGYMSNAFYLGGGGYAGTLNRMGEAQTNLVYLGIVGGLEQSLWPGWGYDISILLGAAATGTAESDLKSSMVLEPRLSLSSYLGGGVRTALSAGYLFLPNAEGFSGPTIGLRVEFKTLTLTTPVDD